MKVYVNKNTHEVCFPCDREHIIAEIACEKIKSSEELEKILARFSKSFIFNMSDHAKRLICDVSDRHCWEQAEQEFNDNWEESELV